jgi:polysaccharide biosynthesis protein PelA
MNNIISVIITISCLSLMWLCTFMLQSAYAQNIHPISSQKKFAIYYSDQHADSEFASYDVIVFDRENHPQLSNLNSKGKVILGYVSGGELDSARSDFNEIKQEHILLEQNPNWKNSYIVDVRSPRWTAHLIEDVIPEILRKGFDGIFIDTLDSIEDLEAKNPRKYRGMTQGAVNMIKTIRRHYPQMKIMVNRAYKILPRVARDIDYVLAESTLAQYNFSTGNSSLFPDEIYEEYVTKAEKLKRQAPHLQIMTVDYWDMNDLAGVRKLYIKQRENGFIPYVTTVDLENIHHNPW